MGDRLLGSHAENLFFIHNCLPWMQGRCTSSTWERGTGVITSEDLGGHYRR